LRILLTGAAGYVGSKLYQLLIDRGYSVVGIDTKWFFDDIGVLKFDVREIGNLDGYDAIIHLAAISNDPSVSFYPRLSWETSVLATQQLAQMAAKTGCRFIYASSVSVYGADRGQVTEDMDPQPISDYNKTKMCAERILLSYPEIRPQIIRPATICGLSPRMRLDLTVNLFTMQALTKGVITVHGGQQYRPSIHIDDMCDLYLFMLEHPELTGIWNAGFENHKLIDIANMVTELTGARIEITEQRDARSYQVNSDKLQRYFVQGATIKDAISDLCIAYRAGKLTNRPEWTNLTWMQTLGIKDE
jgi:nucleoside-diphosphate-sugar epimerase